MGCEPQSKPRLLQKEQGQGAACRPHPPLRPSDLLCRVAGSDVEAAQLLVVVILVIKVLQRLQLLMFTELGPQAGRQSARPTQGL